MGGCISNSPSAPATETSSSSSSRDPASSSRVAPAPTDFLRVDSRISLWKKQSPSLRIEGTGSQGEHGEAPHGWMHPVKALKKGECEGGEIDALNKARLEMSLPSATSNSVMLAYGGMSPLAIRQPPNPT